MSPISRETHDAAGAIGVRVRSTRRLAVARGAGAVASGAGLAVGAAQTAAAHHSYPATYDTNQRVTVTGTVQLVRFVNPHVHVVIEQPLEQPAPPPAEEPAPAEPPAETPADPGTEPVDTLGAVDDMEEAQSISLQAAVEAQGASTLWLLDGPSPAQAERIGLTPANLPPGTSLTVVAWPARNPGSHDLAPITITLHNGFQIRVR